MNDEWGTPQALFRKIDDAFHFDLDVAANAENAKCRRYFTKEDDGLSQCWQGVCWMNPPYSRGQLSLWTEHAATEASLGAVVVGLLPAVTDTQFWHEYVLQAQQIVFLKGRVRFEGPKAGTPTFGSALAIWSAFQCLPKPEVAWWDWRREDLPPLTMQFVKDLHLDLRGAAPDKHQLTLEIA